MTIHEEMPSVQTAVALEARRRKRVFAAFLVLLGVPVAIGLYAVAKAPSETQLVARNVAPLIERNVEKNVEAKLVAHVDRAVEPRVEALVAERATPVIQRALDRQLHAAVNARVQPLEQRFHVFALEHTPEDQRMAERVKRLEARIAALEQRLAAIANARLPVPPEEGIKDRPVLTHVPKRPPQ